MPFDQLPVDAAAYNYATLPVTQSASASSPAFLVFLSSSVAQGALWCPDCVEALPALKEVFGNEDDAPTAHWLEVEREPWKNRAAGQEHFFRTTYGVSNLPTVVRVENGKVVGQIADECKDVETLRKFVKV